MFIVFQYRSTLTTLQCLTPWPLQGPEHSITRSAPWGAYTPCSHNNYFRRRGVDTVLGQVPIHLLGREGALYHCANPLDSKFKPKGAGVMLYFSPELMRKNQKPNQVNDPLYIPAVPTGKSEFGTSKELSVTITDI